MTLFEYLKSQNRGSLVALARAIGSHPPDISNWATGLRPVPPQRAVAIEQATARLVTRKDLRPNDWHLIWPELSKPEQTVSLEESR